MSKKNLEKIQRRASKTLSQGCVICGNEIFKDSFYFKVKGHSVNKIFNAHAKCLIAKGGKY